MVHTFAALLLVSLLVPPVLSAQVVPAPAPAPAPAPPPAPPVAVPVQPGSAPFVHVMQVPTGDPINVRYTLRIRDQGGADPGTKTVGLMATTGEVSSVRAQGITAGRGSNPLNVDVMPSTIRDGKVHTRIGIEYIPQAPADAKGPPPLSVRQTVYVWLNDGTPLVVSESTDPNSDRTLTVEVTAVVIK